MTNPAGLDYKVPSPEFFDDYETGGQYVPPPPAKSKNEKNKLQYVTYVATLPEAKDIEIGATKSGFLKAVFKNITIEGGYVIQQTHVGSEQYNKKDKSGNVTGKRNSSPLGDLFRAAGIDLAQVRPSTAEEYQNLLNGIAGRQVQVTIDWSAYDKDSQADVASTFEDFPEVDGERQPFVEKGDKRFWARASVKRWISAV